MHRLWRSDADWRQNNRKHRFERVLQPAHTAHWTDDLEISQVGFKTFRKTGLVIEANSALRADASLTVGTASEKIEATTNTVHVETESNRWAKLSQERR